MLLQTKKNSNQSLMVIVAWLPELTGHFHVENLRNNESLNVNLEKKKKNSSTASSPKIYQNTS